MGKYWSIYLGQDCLRSVPFGRKEAETWSIWETVLTSASHGWWTCRVIGRTRWKARGRPGRWDKCGNKQGLLWCQQATRSSGSPPSLEFLPSGRHRKRGAQIHQGGAWVWEEKGSRINRDEEGLQEGAPSQSHNPSSDPTWKLSIAAHPIQVLSPGNREERDGRVRVKALLGVHGVEATEFLNPLPVHELIDVKTLCTLQSIIKNVRYCRGWWWWYYYYYYYYSLSPLPQRSAQVLSTPGLHFSLRTWSLVTSPGLQEALCSIAFWKTCLPIPLCTSGLVFWLHPPVSLLSWSDISFHFPRTPFHPGWRWTEAYLVRRPHQHKEKGHWVIPGMVLNKALSKSVVFLVPMPLLSTPELSSLATTV